MALPPQTVSIAIANDVKSIVGIAAVSVTNVHLYEISQVHVILLV